MLACYLFFLLLACAYAQTAIEFPTSATNKLKLVVKDNVNVSAFNLKVVGLPLSSAVCLDANKRIATNLATGDVIVYGLNKTPIKNGEVLELQFTLPNPYGTYTIAVSGIVGATGEAQQAAITVGGDGVIAITFSEAQLVATAGQVVGLGSQGLDLNQDGKVGIVDVQIIANNLK
jgi:hypothetical protein